MSSYQGLKEVESNIVSLAKAGEKTGAPVFKCLTEKDKFRRRTKDVILMDDKESNPSQPKAIFLFFPMKKNYLCTGEYKSNSITSELETTMGGEDCKRVF